MNEGRSLHEVVDRLIEEGLITGDRSGQAAAFLEHRSMDQPWYIRLMVGFGAWLASLLLLGFVAGISLATGGVTGTGIALVAGAVWLRRYSDNDFVVQATLATNFAGQALVAYGVADWVGSNEPEWACSTIIIVNAVLFLVIPDRIHRTFSILFAGSALVALLYPLDLKALVPLVGPLITLALVGLHQNHARLIAAGHGHLLGPLENGLMLVAFCCLMLSTLYVMPEIGSAEIYPRPWLSTLLLAPLFVHVGHRTLSPLVGDLAATARLVAYLLMVALLVTAWNAPGLLLALIVMLLGTSSGNRFFTGAGIAFLALFVTTWFYGIEVTFLIKSITLAASGAVILLARQLMMTQLVPEASHD